MQVCHVISHFYSCIWYVVTCTQFVYVVKYYRIGDIYTMILALFYIWSLYHQILVWIYGTNKDMNINYV
jgi:hypothetical protein